MVRTNHKCYVFKRSTFFKIIYKHYHNKSVTYLSWFIKALEYLIRIKQGVYSVSSLDDIVGDIYLMESEVAIDE